MPHLWRYCGAGVNFSLKAIKGCHLEHILSRFFIIVVVSEIENPRIMRRITIYLFVAFMVLMFNGCSTTTYTPLQMHNTLPTLTQTKYLTREQAEAAVKENKGKYLVRGRSYAAPLGLNPKADLKNGAKGIDEWVKIDGGNAYILNSYKWVNTDGLGTSQLFIEFDTYQLQ
jgi:hypothetical protein